MFRIEFQETARRQLVKIAKRNPTIGRGIKEKIRWLVTNADSVKHEQMHGHAEQSLHSGQ